MNKIRSKLIAGGLLVSFLAYTSPVLSYAKDETVYSKTNTEGENYKTIISTQMEDGINTQEETDEELPITYNIKYALNGKEISAEELAGESGKVAIEITYTNHEKHVVSINGVNTTMYTPFIVVTGVVVNNENNKNITVSKGKIINDGTKTIIVGMAMPEMQESLGLQKVELPDSVKITMETTNFELSNIFTIANPKLLEDDDRKLLEEINEIYGKVNTLQSSSNQIEKGANDLKKGTAMYYEKTQEFNQAMNQVEKGASSANSEYSKINQGIATLNANSTILNNGAKQVSEGMSAVQSGLQNISTKLEQLEVGSQNTVDGAEKIEEGITAAQNAAKDVTTKVLTAKTTLKATIQANQNIIDNLKNQSTIDAEQIANLEANNEVLNQSLQALETLTIDNPTNNLAILNGLLEQVKTGMTGNGTAQNPGLSVGVQAVHQGIAQIKKDGIDVLASQSTKLANGSQELYNGTQTLKQGTAVLENGSSQMQEGLSSLQSGTTQLLQANNQLKDGAKTLQKGAKTLENGIHTFNERGIKPICDSINGDLKNLTDRAEKLLDLSDDYQSFRNSKGNEKGRVKFIIMSDSIKKEKEGKSKAE